MSNPYLGEIRLLPYTFAPADWHDCDGSMLAISQYETLFVLLGTTFGGDGVQTFGLPDMRGRVPIHNGTGNQLNTYLLGQYAGDEAITLNTQQMPQHTHTMFATSAGANTGIPSGTVELGAISGDSLYTSSITGLSAKPIVGNMIGNYGGNTAHENRMPTLTMRFCIALSGIFPSQS